VTRAQESTSATTKNTASKTYKMIAGLTAKTMNSDLAIIQAANGRLTLESGVPVSTTNQTAKTTIYFTPYQGNCISVYDGMTWVCHQFTELSLALGTLVADKNYDVFVYDNAGTLTLELGAAWTSDIARADAVSLQDGILVKTGALTRKLLGTIRTTSTTTTEDSLTKRLVSNVYNRKIRDMFMASPDTHTYNGPYRQWEGDATNQLAFVSTVVEDAVAAIVGGARQATAAVYVAIGLALDSTTTIYRGAEGYGPSSDVGDANLWLSMAFAPQLGYHLIVPLQTTLSGGLANFGNLQLAAYVVG
jgi:hypothetical protein